MKIVVLDGYTLNPGDLSWQELHKLGDLEIHDRTPDAKILERCKGAEIVFTNKTILNEEVVSQLTGLRYIGVLATGYNVVDTAAAKTYDIIVSNVPGYGTASVVQMTFALLLELCQHVQAHSDAVGKGEWANAADWCFWKFPLMELADKTLGIIGFGNIGRQVADVATAFGMNILACSRRRTEENRKKFRWTELPELLQKSDVVSIHCPLLPATKGLINKDALLQMSPAAFLINTSRGPIVVEEDLAYALNNNIIAGAAVDVLGLEPPRPDNPLFTAKNCIITPHIAWATKEARQRLMKIAFENLKSFLNGEPKNVVNI